MVADTDTKEGKSLGVDAHKQGGALPVLGAAPAQAEGTVSVGPASGAERAAAAKPDALEPVAHGKAGRQGEAGREVETLPLREGVCEIEVLLRKGKCKPELLLRSNNTLGPESTSGVMVASCPALSCGCSDLRWLAQT